MLMVFREALVCCLRSVRCQVDRLVPRLREKRGQVHEHSLKTHTLIESRFPLRVREMCLDGNAVAFRVRHNAFVLDGGSHDEVCCSRSKSRSAKVNLHCVK